MVTDATADLSLALILMAARRAGEGVRLQIDPSVIVSAIRRDFGDHKDHAAVDKLAKLLTDAVLSESFEATEWSATEGLDRL